MRCENAIAAKARAMYGQMLSPAQYRELVHRQSVQEIASYLKNKTCFSAVLAELQEGTAHRGLLETLLQRDLFYQYARLVKYAQGREGIYNFIILQVEIELIIACLRENASPLGQDLIAIAPAQVRPYACFDIFALAKAKTLDDILQVVAKTPYEKVLADCRRDHPAELGPEFPFSAYETALRRYYLQAMLDRAGHSLKGRPLVQLREMVLMRADLLNLGALFRMKAFFHLSRTQVGERLLPFYGKLSPRMIAHMTEAENIQDLLGLIRKSPYGKAFAAFDPQQETVESVIQRIMLHKWQHFMRFATDPQVVFTAFMLLRGLELENITRIIEGVRYQLPPDRIESLLCR